VVTRFTLEVEGNERPCFVGDSVTTRVMVVIAIPAAPFVMARAFRQIAELRGLRTYSLATGIVAVAATVVYVLLYGDPGAGIAQRVLVLVSMAWIAVLSFSILKIGPSSLGHRVLIA
jgi:hypothetical protein